MLSERKRTLWLHCPIHQPRVRFHCDLCLQRSVIIKSADQNYCTSHDYFLSQSTINLTPIHLLQLPQWISIILLAKWKEILLKKYTWQVICCYFIDIINYIHFHRKQHIQKHIFFNSMANNAKCVHSFSLDSGVSKRKKETKTKTRRSHINVCHTRIALYFIGCSSIKKEHVFQTNSGPAQIFFMYLNFIRKPL